MPMDGHNTGGLAQGGCKRGVELRLHNVRAHPGRMSLNVRVVACREGHRAVISAPPS